MRRAPGYWARYGVTWFIINIVFASFFHLALGIPWRHCGNLYVGAGFLIFGLLAEIFSQQND